MPLGLLALALVAGATIILFLNSHRLATIVPSVATGVARRRGGWPELGGTPPVLKLYLAFSTLKEI
jgi:hypothetical protein